mmetsp:Transcript_41775/g.100618  ORF Transcript_41775/g.100618 Transcript_41775/m.100618 type:complete len:110 (-) Transcript_41775:677-1006(-)
MGEKDDKEKSGRHRSSSDKKRGRKHKKSSGSRDKERRHRSRNKEHDSKDASSLPKEEEEIPTMHAVAVEEIASDDGHRNAPPAAVAHQTPTRAQGQRPPQKIPLEKFGK